MIQAKRQFAVESGFVIRKLIDRNNPSCPFSKFIGNNNAVDILADIAFSALSQPDHSCKGVRLAIFGQASTGKTTLGKLFSEVLDLPFLYLSAEEIQNIDYLFNCVESKLEEEFIYLSKLGESAGKIAYCLPPMVIFIDEIHALSPVIRNNLLSALEAKISTLITHSAEIDCSEVYWLVATTERGRLSLPLESRFIPISLISYTVAEIAKIVYINTGWNESTCSLVAKFTKIPRDAISFAKQVDLAAKRANISLLEAVMLTAKRRGINDSGLDKIQITVMMALAENEKGQSIKALCGSAGVNMAEMENYVLPLLLLNNFVSVSNKHFITKNGLSYLKKRNLI